MDTSRTDISAARSGPEPSNARHGVHDPVLDTTATSELTGLAKPTLQKHRTEGTGPSFIKLGKRRVGYRLSDIRAWLDARVVASTSDARARGLSTSN